MGMKINGLKTKETSKLGKAKISLSVRDKIATSNKTLPKPSAKKPAIKVVAKTSPKSKAVPLKSTVKLVVAKKPAIKVVAKTSPKPKAAPLKSTVKLVATKKVNVKTLMNQKLTDKKFTPLDGMEPVTKLKKNKSQVQKNSTPPSIQAKEKVIKTIENSVAKVIKSSLKGVAAPLSVKTLAPSPASPEQLAAAGVAARTGRPSSRLAQLTVPSIAQAVASNTAKSSFINQINQTLISPPSPFSIKKDIKLANNWKTKELQDLTDADVLAMPDNLYMKDIHFAFFRLKLTKLKQDMLDKAGETTQHLKADTVIVPDPADRATIEEEHALELRTRDRERKLLKKIQQSINQIDEGVYGYCEETGEPIGIGRLLARPTATLSLEAQQRRELKQRMFGD